MTPLGEPQVCRFPGRGVIGSWSDEKTDSKKIFRDIKVSKIDENVSATFKQSTTLYERRVYEMIDDQNAAPLLREQSLSFVKSKLSAGRPITLLTTQVVETGVDLDFEAGFTDLISLPSTLQRGGRVAREARPDGCPRTLTVFNFKTIVNDQGQEVERTTKDIFDSLTLDSINLTEKAKKKIQLLLSNTQSATRQYFQAWDIAVKLLPAAKCPNGPKPCAAGSWLALRPGSTFWYKLRLDNYMFKRYECVYE